MASSASAAPTGEVPDNANQREFLKGIPSRVQTVRRTLPRLSDTSWDPRERSGAAGQGPPRCTAHSHHCTSHSVHNMWHSCRRLLLLPHSSRNAHT